jgi:hypothetical protein
MVEEKSVTATIGGAPVSWVALMGALLGAGSIIPLVYYIEGGGYHSLSYALVPIVAAILGPWGAGAAAAIGWAVGLFIAPGTTIIGLFVNMSGPAVAAGLILNKKWKWIVWVPLLGIVWFELTPWYWPGLPGGISSLPQPFLALSVWYDALTLPLLLTVGRNIVPDWIKGKDRKKMFAGLMLLSWISTQMCHLWSWTPWILFFYPIPAYVVAVLQAVSVPFERLMLQVVSGIIGVPIILSLRRSGLRKIPTAVW